MSLFQVNMVLKFKKFIDFKFYGILIVFLRLNTSHKSQDSFEQKDSFIHRFSTKQ